MALGPPPPQGESVELLSRYVKELYDYVRCLDRIRVVGTIPQTIQGKGEIKAGELVITIQG
jgi:hypothetical protein